MVEHLSAKQIIPVCMRASMCECEWVCVGWFVCLHGCRINIHLNSLIVRQSRNSEREREKEIERERKPHSLPPGSDMGRKCEWSRHFQGSREQWTRWNAHGKDYLCVYYADKGSIKRFAKASRLLSSEFTDFWVIFIFMQASRRFRMFWFCSFFFSLEWTEIVLFIALHSPIIHFRPIFVWTFCHHRFIYQSIHGPNLVLFSPTSFGSLCHGECLSFNINWQSNFSNIDSSFGTVNTWIHNRRERDKMTIFSQPLFSTS